MASTSLSWMPSNTKPLGFVVSHTRGPSVGDFSEHAVYTDRDNGKRWLKVATVWWCLIRPRTAAAIASVVTMPFLSTC